MSRLLDRVMPVCLVATALPVLLSTDHVLRLLVTLLLISALNLGMTRAIERQSASLQQPLERAHATLGAVLVFAAIYAAGACPSAWLLVAPWMVCWPLLLSPGWALFQCGLSIAAAFSACVLQGADPRETGFALGASMFFGVSLTVVSTALRRRSNDLQIVLERLAHALEVKQSFLATMSHELRTPMNGVIGMADVLAGTSLTREQLECVDTIQVCGHSLLALINEILDLAHIQGGATQLQHTDFEVAVLVRSIVTVMKPPAAARGLDVIVDIDAQVPRRICGDPHRLRQVLVNLVSNAVKFTPAGQVTVRVRRSADEELRFEVIDTGIGIRRELHAAIFEDFTQADSSMTRRFGGTGLGLAVCRRVVHLMGGEIGVASQVEKGSTFWFTIKVREAAGSSSAWMAVGATSATAIKAAPDRRVLLVEDNNINQVVAARMLQRLGFRVELARNGKQAVERFEPDRYVAVLMDCQMPVMDGHAATRAIRAMESPPSHTYIIAMTANVLPNDRRACFDSGMDDFIAKPMTLDTLAEALTRGGAECVSTPIILAETPL